MTFAQAPLSFLVFLFLSVVTLLTPASAFAQDLPGSTLPTPADLSEAAQTRSRAPNLVVARQGYDLLLDRYVYPLNPADLLAAAYVGLEKALVDSGVRVRAAGPLQLDPDRERAWTAFAARVETLLQEAAPPPGLDVNAVLVDAMARSVDEGHTAYLTPQRYQDFLAYMRGDQRYGGIGIRPSRPGVTVVEVFAGSPAERAGILPGDLILSVDGQTTVGKTLEQVAQLIRGPEGTPVSLEIERPRTAERLTFSILRASIKVEYISTELIQDSVGYIKLRGFPEQSVADRFEQFMDALPTLRARGLIIDLRGNSGGRIDVGLRLLNRFIRSGPLFDQVDRTGRHRTQSANGPGWENPLPVAILIDEGTASMGEIFAAAMRENGIARLIGKKSAGNVAAAQVFPLGDGSAVQITILEIFSGKGARLNQNGVVPDDVLDSTAEQLDRGQDVPLEAAVNYVWDQSPRAAAAVSPYSAPSLFSAVTSEY